MKIVRVSSLSGRPSNDGPNQYAGAADAGHATTAADRRLSTATRTRPSVSVPTCREAAAAEESPGNGALLHDPTLRDDDRETLLSLTERYCVAYQTLARGADVTVSYAPAR
jgi:hypothetical protein